MTAVASSIWVNATALMPGTIAVAGRRPMETTPVNVCHALRQRPGAGMKVALTVPPCASFWIRSSIVSPERGMRLLLNPYSGAKRPPSRAPSSDRRCTLSIGEWRIT